MELGKGNVKFADFHRTKGCHAFKTGYYKGSVFYGLGGNDKEISEPFDRKASTYRPDGYDCSPNSNTLTILVFQHYLIISNLIDKWLQNIEIYMN